MTDLDLTPTLSNPISWPTYVLDTNLFLQNSTLFDHLCQLPVHLDLPLYA